MDSPVSPPSLVEPSGRMPARGVALAVTAAWLGGGAAYMHLALGWDLTSLRPGEAIGLISGLILPLAILWQTVASIEHGRQLRRETQALGEQLRELLYPAAEHEGRVRTMADSLRAQAKAMTTASSEAASRAQAERLALRLQMEEMERLADRVETAFAAPVQSLQREVARVEEITAAAVARAREVEERLTAQVAEAARASETTLTVVEAGFGKITEEARGFEVWTQALCERLEGAATAVGDRLGQLADAGGNAAEQFDRLGRVVDDQSAVVAAACGRAEATAASVGQRGSDLEQALARQNDALNTVAQRLDRDGERLLEGLAARTAAWEAALAVADRNGAALAATVDGSAQRLRDAGESAVVTIETLTQRLDASGDALQTTVTAVDERLAAASEWFDSSSRAMKTAADEMGEQAREFTSAGDLAAAGLAELKQALGLHLQSFNAATASAEQTAAALEQRTQGVGELLARSGDELGAMVARLVTEGGNAATSIEKQAALLDDSAGRARDSLGSAERVLAEQTQQLAATTGDAAQRLEAGGEGLERKRQALAQTIEIVIARMDEAGTAFDRRRLEIEGTAGRLEQGASGLAATAGGAVNAVQACVDALKAHAERLGNAFEVAEGAAAHMNERGEQLDRSMRGHREQLSETVDRVAGEAAAAAALLARETESLRRTAVEIAERTAQAENGIGSGTERLVTACTKAIDAVAGSTTALLGKGEALASGAEPVCRQLSQLAATLATEREAALAAAERAAEVATLLTDRNDSLGEAVNTRAVALVEAAHQAVQTIDSSLERSAAGLDGVLERIAAEGGRLEHHQGEMLRKTELFAAAAGQAEGSLAAGTQRLEAVCEQAAARAMAAAERLAAMTQALGDAYEAARTSLAPTAKIAPHPAGESAAESKPTPTAFGLKLLYGLGRTPKDGDEKKK